MQRRDLSRALFASATGAALLSPLAQAQTTNPPYYAITPAEAALAATIPPIVSIVNYSYPPGYVDRYETNVTPGTTDMSAAFSSAFAVAGYVGNPTTAPKTSGCSVRWGATGQYYLGSPVNCTQIRGVVAHDETSGNASSIPPGVIIGHAGHGFDLSGSTELVFNNVSATSAPGMVPKTLFFMARNTAGSGAGIHRFNNVRTASNCTFSNVFYSYGSEENIYSNCEIYNSQGGSTCFNHTTTNTSAYSSTFMSIASGNQSNSVHRHVGGSYVNLGNSGSVNEVVFQLEGCANFTFRDGMWDCPNGLAYVRVVGVGVGRASVFLTFDSIRGEPGGGAHPTYGVDVVSSGTTGSNSHVFWTFNNVYSDSSGELLNFASGAEIQNLTLRACGAQSGKLLAIYNMSQSIVENGTSLVTGQAGATVQSNFGSS